MEMCELLVDPQDKSRALTTGKECLHHLLKSMRNWFVFR